MKKLLTFEREFMRTGITFHLVKENQGTIETADLIEEAFGEFDRIVKKYTRFDENSELSNLNRNNGSWTKVSKEFFDLVKFMIRISEESKGAFDPTIIDFLEMYGYDKSRNFEKLKDPNLQNHIKSFAESRPHWSEIEFDDSDLKIKLAKNQRIDLGGVGKGYAVDCAFNKIEKIYDNFLINAGGDIRSKGKNIDNIFWRTQLQGISNETKMVSSLNNEHMENNVLGEIELNNESLSSSGSWARKVGAFHHIINPETGSPVKNNYSTVFVIAPTALESDAWATALFVGGEEVIKNTQFKYLLD